MGMDGQRYKHLAFNTLQNKNAMKISAPPESMVAYMGSNQST